MIWGEDLPGTALRTYLAGVTPYLAWCRVGGRVPLARPSLRASSKPNGQVGDEFALNDQDHETTGTSDHGVVKVSFRFKPCPTRLA